MLAVGPFLPVTFANTGGVSASPNIAAPNSTINIQTSATVTLPTPTGYYNSIFFIAVLTPSGTTYGCIGGSSACDLVGFSATGPGTYSCGVPFGGATSSLSVATTGGVTAPGDCTGSDAGTWTGMSSTLCGGVAPEGANCVGVTGFNDLVTGCDGSTSYFIGFGVPNLTPFAGDSSQSGTYNVVVCWQFATQDPNGGAPTFTSVASTTTFQITPSTGVPEFPLGLVALLAVAVPLMLLVKAKSSELRRYSRVPRTDSPS